MSQNSMQINPWVERNERRGMIRSEEKLREKDFCWRSSCTPLCLSDETSLAFSFQWCHSLTYRHVNQDDQHEWRRITSEHH